MRTWFSCSKVLAVFHCCKSLGVLISSEKSNTMSPFWQIWVVVGRLIFLRKNCLLSMYVWGALFLLQSSREIYFQHWICYFQSAEVLYFICSPTRALRSSQDGLGAVRRTQPKLSPGFGVRITRGMTPRLIGPSPGFLEEEEHTDEKKASFAGLIWQCLILL